MIKDKLKAQLKDNEHENKLSENNKVIIDDEKDVIENKETGVYKSETAEASEAECCDDQEKLTNEAQAEEEIGNMKEELLTNEEEIKKKNEEIESLMDLLKRRRADFENYKKRMIKEKEEYKKLAVKDMALDIIDIYDDLLRALDAASNISEKESLEDCHRAVSDGVLMISKRIEEILAKYGIVEIDCINQEFDPKFNEAVEIEMSEDIDKDTITKIYQKGFRLDDYILRCSRVKVAKPIKEE